MKIPEVRDRLREIARERGLPELEALADALRRRRHGRVAPVRARPMTDELAAHIRAYAAQHPQASQQQIGEVFGVTAGRVSEALFGRRA